MRCRKYVRLRRRSLAFWSFGLAASGRSVSRYVRYIAVKPSAAGLFLHSRAGGSWATPRKRDRAHVFVPVNATYHKLPSDMRNGLLTGSKGSTAVASNAMVRERQAGLHSRRPGGHALGHADFQPLCVVRKNVAPSGVVPITGFADTSRPHDTKDAQHFGGRRLSADAYAGIARRSSSRR
jgi:hypothetical protein